jgi:hypothetical protein
MKKFIPLLFLVITACHSENANFTKIKTGMKSKDVISLVGEPESKTSMMVAEWWNYPKDNKIIVMANDTVTNVVMDLKAAGDSMKSASDKLEKAMKSLDTAK